MKICSRDSSTSPQKEQTGDEIIPTLHIPRKGDCLQTLGVLVDESLTWKAHIDEISKKISASI